VIPVTRTGGLTSVVSVPAGGVVPGRSSWIDLAAVPHVARRQAAMNIVLAEAARPAGGSRATTILSVRELLDDAAFYRDHRRLFDESRRICCGATWSCRDGDGGRLAAPRQSDTLDRGRPPAYVSGKQGGGAGSFGRVSGACRFRRNSLIFNEFPCDSQSGGAVRVWRAACNRRA